MQSWAFQMLSPLFFFFPSICLVFPKGKKKKYKDVSKYLVYFSGNIRRAHKFKDIVITEN